MNISKVWSNINAQKSKNIQANQENNLEILSTQTYIQAMNS
jgi:hypothetical protein